MVNKDIDVITRQQSEDDLMEVKEEGREKDKIEGETPTEGEEGESAKTKAEEENAFSSIDLDPSKLPKYSHSLAVGKLKYIT